MDRFTFKRSDFPDGFVFGAATSAYQIEGQSFGGAGPTHWDSFAAAPGNVANAEDGSVACDHYHRFADDLDLVRDARLDTYRFSINWARVLPEGRGAVNADGLGFYDRLIDAMLERGLQPFATLYHWEMPSALTDLGGWMHPDVAHWFADYAALVTAHIGDRVTRIATVNEPICTAWLGHFTGHHAPGYRDIRATARAMHHVLKAHGQAMTVLRDMGQTGLGIVINRTHHQPVDDTPASHLAVARADAIFNDWFLSGIFHGTYPDLALEGLGPHLPKGWEQDMDTIRQPMDWLGLNYYFRQLLTLGTGPWPAIEDRIGGLPRTQMGWEVSSEGFYHQITRTARDFSGDLPMYITENGMANDDTVTARGVEDWTRIAYLDDHLAAVRRAIADGVPLRGYFAWSLLDNYEWALGYEKRFGLVHVDFQTQKRTPKASYLALKEALGRN